MATYPVRFHQGERFVRVFFTAGLIITVFALLIIFVPRATVKIVTRSEPAIVTMEVRLDSTLSKFTPLLMVLPAHLALSDEDSASLLKSENYSERLALESPAGRKFWHYRQSDLTELARRELRGMLRQGWILAPPNEPKIVIQKIDTESVSLNPKLTVRAEGVAIPEYPIEEWRRTAGYWPERLESRIMANPDIDRVEIKIVPSFWPFLPLVLDRLDFTLDTP